VFGGVSKLTSVLGEGVSGDSYLGAGEVAGEGDEADPANRSWAMSAAVSRATLMKKSAEGTFVSLVSLALPISVSARPLPRCRASR
jgi:hypothetical protein